MSDAIGDAWEQLRQEYYGAGAPEEEMNVKGVSSEKPPTFIHKKVSNTGQPGGDANNVVGEIANSELMAFLDTIENGDAYKQELKNLAMEWYWKGFYLGFERGSGNDASERS